MPFIRSFGPMTLGLLMGLNCLTLSATETATQSLDAIRSVAEQYLLEAAQDQYNGRVTVNMGPLDSRLRLAACGETLEAFQPSGARLSGHTSVGVRCPGPRTWSIYITADIDLFADALVLTRPLARGQSVTAQDVKLVETEVSRLGQGYLYDPNQIEGMVARRAINSGAVLTPSLVKAPRLIRRGDRVTLVNASGPIRVEMQGEALADGVKGERVKVRALDSRQIVEGWVISTSVVKVTL